MRQFLGIDVGGSAIKYSLLNDEAEILEKGEVPTPKDSLESFVNAIGDLYDQYAGNVEAVVMSAPGRIDSAKGYMFTGGALQYIGQTDMANELARRVSVPIAIENDAKCAALAEVWKGSLQGYQSGVVIVLGTGIGGAVVIDGKLVRGNTFAAGELSCVNGRWDKPEFDFADSWTNVNSTTGLIDLYAAETGIDKKELNGRLIFEKVNAGDEVANRVLKTFCQLLVKGIYSIQAILDVQRYCIGGGISKQEKLMQYIEEENNALFGKLPFFVPVHQPEIVTCAYGNDANMIGALYHYLFEMKA